MRKPVVFGRALDALIALYNSIGWLGGRLVVVPRESQLYAEDGLWTVHAHAFVEELRFARAYERAQNACGYDYGIRWRTHTVLWAAAQAARLEGAFVECGTGRGWMASAICELLDWKERPFYLFDTFLGAYPDESGAQLAGGAAQPNYAESPESVRDNFAEWPGVELVVGRIPDTLTDVGPVAFLHIDMNNAVAEEHAVRHFWPAISKGGIMVFDDYGFEGFESQRRSADRLAEELGFQILTMPTGQGLVIR